MPADAPIAAAVLADRAPTPAPTSTPAGAPPEPAPSASSIVPSPPHSPASATVPGPTKLAVRFSAPLRSCCSRNKGILEKKKMSDSHVPRRELLRRRRTLVPDGAANSTDIVPSYVPQPVVASATHRKRRADAPLKETDPNGMASSSSSSRSTRRRTSFGEINAIQNEQAETHAQASQIEALMPGKHITGSPPSDQAINSGTHPGQRAEASLALDHANTMHKKAGSHEVFGCASGEHIAVRLELN
ncbi:hypothetical protein EJB05_49219, partial [Eragrostis curvula]